MSQKNMKDRSVNFTKEEIDKFMALLKEYPIITCKKTDHASVQKKEMAWRKLTDSFNQNTDFYRSKKQLQYKLNNLKKNAKKEVLSERKARRPCGDQPPPNPSTPTEWNDTMGESITSLASVSYDSDMDKEENENVPVNSLPHAEDNEPLGYHLKEPNVIQYVEQQDDFATVNPSNGNLEDETNDFLTFDTKELDMNKKKSLFSPSQARKKIIAHLNKKDEALTSKSLREVTLIKMAQEEHEINMRQKQELHSAQMELLNMEIAYKRNIYKLDLQKAEVMLQVEKMKLENNYKRE